MEPGFDLRLFFSMISIEMLVNDLFSLSYWKDSNVLAIKGVFLFTEMLVIYTEISISMNFLVTVLQQTDIQIQDGSNLNKSFNVFPASLNLYFETNLFKSFSSIPYSFDQLNWLICSIISLLGLGFLFCNKGSSSFR